MPNAENPGDKIFQISCVLYRQSTNKLDKYLLTLGEPNPDVVGDDVEIYMYDTEYDLLRGYTEFIVENNPNVIIGYNIFGFDIPYMMDRAITTQCYDSFDQQGFTKYAHAKEQNISWSSSAYGNQIFRYLDAEGRLFIDLLPVVKRKYKLDNYRLKTVSEQILTNQTKDPLTPKGIFKCYRIGIKKNNGKFSRLAKKAMGIVGKYCVQDSVLVAKLFENLQTWVDLSEMAKVCNVPIFYLYTKGQQIKVYSQLYKYCMHHNFVVEKDGYTAKENDHYVGATVFVPKPGVYKMVLPFDFASLYPTTMIAYNFDYSTLVLDPDIPEKDCITIEWEDHNGCEHDKSGKKPKYKTCASRCFKWLKEPKGVVPIVLQNLLDARANTRYQKKILEKIISDKKLQKEEQNIFNTELINSLDRKYDYTKRPLSKDAKYVIKLLIDVLNKRQLAYKVSANSMYGTMGVKKGYLPFMPGAMCTTAMGRKNINKVADVIQDEYKGDLIYGDTDSNYVIFPHLKTAQENWDYAEYVASEITKIFPKPIKLEFEEEIYYKILLLSKKRYMFFKCKRDGIVDDGLGKKGVLLARRDNCNLIRNIYSNTVIMIFEEKKRDDVLFYITKELDKICGNFYSHDTFTITKSIRDNGNGSVIEFVNEKKVLKGKMGDYTVPLLSNDAKERARQFKLKKCNSVKEYYTRCLPAVVQLAIKMRKRGKRVSPGTRLEYIILDQGGPKANQYEKIEDVEYYTRHSTSLKIDHMYYVKLMANPIDDILNVIYDRENSGYKYKFNKNFVLNQYKYRLKIRNKMLDELKKLFEPRIVFDKK